MENLLYYQEAFKSALNSLQYPATPNNLYDPIDYILKLGGKRIRPILVFLGNKLFDGQINKVVEHALAIEIFHNFSLVHDDIMDEAPIRRGQDTVHIKWNTPTAILAGDAMMIQAINHLIKGSSKDTLADVLGVFNRTAIEVCEGQQMDMDFEERDDVSIDGYIKMISLKTAVLLGGALQIGSIEAGANEEDQKRLYEFGKNIGIAFQLQDDILDVFGDEGVGKITGGDIISNKKTFLLLKLSELINEEAFNEALAIEDPNEKVAVVTELYEKFGVREVAEEQMNLFYQKALKNLDLIASRNEAHYELKELAKGLMVRVS